MIILELAADDSILGIEISTYKFDKLSLFTFVVKMSDDNGSALRGALVGSSLKSTQVMGSAFLVVL